MEPNLSPDPSRDKHPTVEETPFSVEDTGISNEEKINKLLATAVNVREELYASRRKIIIVFTCASVILILVLGFAVGVLWGLRGQANKLREIASVNLINGAIVRENSDAIKDATGPEARARSSAATVDALRRIAIETDCRSRRQQARIPAPDPNVPCDQQTDANIFPGIIGEPAR